MSDPEPGHNRLAALAADIQAAHADVTRGALAVAERALGAGRMLIEAKAAIPHGEWATWLDRNTELSPRTARRYMQLVGSGAETATVADLGVKGAVTKLARCRVPRPSPGHIVWGVADNGLALLIWPVDAEHYHVVCAPLGAQFNDIVVTDRPVPGEFLSLTVAQTGFPIGATRLRIFAEPPEEQGFYEKLLNFGLGGDWHPAETASIEAVSQDIAAEQREAGR